MLLAIDAIWLPTERPFRWRAVWMLGALFIVGKLANIPLYAGIWLLAATCARGPGAGRTLNRVRSDEHRQASSRYAEFGSGLTP
ncbi:MAG: hypothetical protein BMS9Abin28_2500 [Anaerolineae bacterium]|nr:MAG: hypothetical protein BMS9Abin28_2500 [Anaerolineae bacterium]